MVTTLYGYYSKTLICHISSHGFVQLKLTASDRICKAYNISLTYHVVILPAHVLPI